MNAEKIMNKSHLKDTNIGPCQLKINKTTSSQCAKPTQYEDWADTLGDASWNRSSSKSRSGKRSNRSFI